MMGREISFAIVVWVVMLTTAVSAAQLGGELQAGLIYELDDGFSGVPLKVMLSAEDDLQGQGRLYISVKGLFDPVTDTQDLTLDKAYASLYLGAVDMTVGRQVISWGTVDGFGPTNYFTRLGDDAITQGSLVGEPVTGLQASYFSPSWSFTGVVIPVFTPQKISRYMQDAFMSDPARALLLQAVESAALPERSLKNMEVGVRAETSLRGWDVQLSAYSGFEPLPGISLVLDFDPTTMAPQLIPQGTYRRQHYLGAALAGFLGDLGIKAELAYGGPQPFPEDEIPLSQNKPLWKGVLGAEYVVPIKNGVLVQGQYLYEGRGSLFSPYNEPMVDPKAGHYLMGRVSYNFTLENSVELLALYSMEDSSALVLPGFTYKLGQGAEIKGQLIKSLGTGELNLLPDSVQMSLTYRF